MLGEQVKVRKRRVELDSSLSTVFEGTWNFARQLSKKKENENDSNISLKLEELSESINRGQTPEQLKFFTVVEMKIFS